MIIIVDSYAWIEYFMGSKKGEKVVELLENKNYEFLTLECCLAEIKTWSIRNGQDFDKLYPIIRSNSTVIRVIEQDWILAAEIRIGCQKKGKDLGLIDACILAVQNRLSTQVLSGDKHFKDMPKTIFLS